MTMMEATARNDKKVLRQEYLARRRAIPADERLLLDRAIAARILDLKEFELASGIVAYCSDGSEPDLAMVLESVLKCGKVLALPRFNAACGEYEPVRVENPVGDLVTGRYGLAEPEPGLPAVRPAADWLWLIPGVAFDRRGNRLGRGKGFYDRLLAEYEGIGVGVFYRRQFYDGELPSGAHDRKLALAVTEIETIKF